MTQTHPEFVLDKCVKCIHCKEPILLVFDPKIRETHNSCGDHFQIEYSTNFLNETDEEEE